MGAFSSVRDWFADISPTWMVMIFAGPYVAGAKDDDAVIACRKLWDTRKLLSTLDVLGESSKEVERCREWARMYIAIQSKIGDIPSCYVSLKPTALGLLVSEPECFTNIEAVVSSAKKVGQGVCIDMEDKSTTDVTFKLYRTLRDKGLDNVSSVVQAYMKRTPADVEALIKAGYKPNLRICKGIYKADRDFKTMAEINDNYVKTARLMLENGCYVGLATHDLMLIDRIKKEVLEPLKITPDKYEWQMLHGVPVEKKQDELVRNGEHVRIYVPFGPNKDAAAYCRRRFKENPKMFYFVLKNIFSHH